MNCVDRCMGDCRFVCFVCILLGSSGNVKQPTGKGKTCAHTAKRTGQQRHYFMGGLCVSVFARTRALAVYTIVAVKYTVKLPKDLNRRMRTINTNACQWVRARVCKTKRNEKFVENCLSFDFRDRILGFQCAACCCCCCGYCRVCV